MGVGRERFENSLPCHPLIQHIYFYINILLVLHESILQQYKEQYIFFLTRFSPTLIHFSLFPNKTKSLILDFIKLCTHNLSRLTFASELSTNLIYKVFLS